MLTYSQFVPDFMLGSSRDLIGTEEIAQQVKHLLNKHEDLSSIPSFYRKSQV